MMGLQTRKPENHKNNVAVAVAVVRAFVFRNFCGRRRTAAAGGVATAAATPVSTCPFNKPII